MFDETLSSAKKGDKDAQCEVGDMYAQGEGVVQDLEEAKKWYYKAVNGGLIYVVPRLANLYFNERTKESDISAYKFYMISIVDGGFKTWKWIEKLKNERNMSVADIAKAEYEIGNFYYSESSDRQILKACVFYKISKENGYSKASFKVHETIGVENGFYANECDRLFQFWKNSAKDFVFYRTLFTG